MKINNHLYITFLLLITGIVCGGYIGYEYWKQTHFACDSQLTIVGAEGKEEIIMHFRFSGDTGHMETRGKYILLNGEEVPTSNRVNFNFLREGDSLVLVSNETNRLPKKSLSILQGTPDFFSTRERGIRLEVIRKNSAGYIFMYENTPVLYCRSAPGTFSLN